MTGTSDRHGAIKGTFTNSSGGSNGTFSGALVTGGTGTNISTATATGTITLTFDNSFTAYKVNLSFSGVPKFSPK